MSNKFTKITVMGLALAILSFFSMNAFAEDTGSVPISGTVSAPISVSSTTGLTGWELTKPSSGECVYSVSGSDTSVSSNSNGDCTVLTAASGGSFTLSGESGKTVDLSYSNTGFGDSNIKIDSFSDGEGNGLGGGSITLNNSSKTFGSLSADIKVKSGLSTGDYSTTINVTATYQ